MKKTVHFFLLITAGLFITTGIIAQDDNLVPDSQIKRSIQTFINLTDAQRIKQFGLSGIAELKSLQAGRQYKKYMIGLNDIKNYKQGDNVKKLIKPYPSVEVSLVNATGRIRTSIEFVKHKGKWVAAGYGSTPEFLLLSKTRDTLQNTPLSSLVSRGDLIRIPALLVAFIAVPSANSANMEFIVLGNYPKLKLFRGQKLAASTVMQLLAPLARKHNGLPT